MKHTNGFTLLETLVYIALLGILITGVFSVAYNLMEGTARINKKILLHEEATFILRKIGWAIADATSITIPSANVLSINKIHFAQNPIIFDESGGIVRITRGSGIAIPLNSVRAPVEDLSFTHVPRSGIKPEGVQVILSIHGQQFEALWYLKQ